MKRLIVFTAFLLTASYALAQAPAPAKPPKPPPATAPVPAPPPPPAPPAPPRGGQPINVRVELTISESGAGAPPVRKSVVAVVGDGFNGYVRETGVVQNAVSVNPAFERVVSPLNLDARPEILAGGKIRLVCTIQYQATQRPTQDRVINTDIKQNLVLNLESGKALLISDATDPITDRRVSVEVTATILK